MLRSLWEGVAELVEGKDLRFRVPPSMSMSTRFALVDKSNAIQLIEDFGCESFEGPRSFSHFGGTRACIRVGVCKRGQFQ